MSEYFIEEWLPIDGYDNYMVSNKGKIKNINTNHCLIPEYTSTGMFVNLKLTKHKIKRRRVDELVAEAFLGRSSAMDKVYHIDGNVYNNYVDNLEWRVKYSSPSEIYRNTKVRCIETGEIFDSIYQCSEIMSLSVSSLKNCLKHKTVKTRDGYSFEFVE